MEDWAKQLASLAPSLGSAGDDGQQDTQQAQQQQQQSAGLLPGVHSQHKDSGKEEAVEGSSRPAGHEENAALLAASALQALAHKVRRLEGN